MLKKKYGYWTKENLLKSAKKYATSKEWRKNEYGAYQVAWRKNIIANVTKHMRTLGNSFRRCIYSIKVKNNKIIYIGLTSDFERRKYQHIKHNRVIKNLIEKNGIKSLIFKKLTNYIPREEAQSHERNLVKEFRKKRFHVLNKKRAGNLGGNTIKWTKDKILENAKKYNTRNEWYENEPGAAQAAKKFGIVNDVKKHMISKYKYRTKKEILEIISKFKSFKEWREVDQNSYYVAQRMNLLNDNLAIGHLKKEVGSGIIWYPKKIFEEATKYNQAGIFAKKSSSAFQASIRLGIYKAVSKKMGWNRNLNKTYRERRLNV